MKAFYFDVETTGLDYRTAAMTQIAAIAIIDGEEVDRIALDINPYTYAKDPEVSEKALEVTNKTEEEIRSYPDSRAQFKKFIQFLDRYIDKYNKQDKFTPIGYNSQFDMGFLRDWFDDNKHKFFGSYFVHKDVDVFALVKHLEFLGLLPATKNHKLGTMCEAFGVDLGENAHDAVADIRATRELYQVLVTRYVKS